MSKVRVAVLISGSGSNLQALIDAARAADYPAEISLVLSNKDDAYGLTRATNAGIATEILSHKNFESREAFDRAMHAILMRHEIQLVCLAGFMRVLSEWFVGQWQGKLINIHPALLPNYKGLHTHARAIAAGEKEAGATVHWVVPEVDGGEIILQASVPVMPDDTAEALAARVLEQEHRIYPLALKTIILQGAAR